MYPPVLPPTIDLQVPLDRRLQLMGIRANNLIDLLAVLEQQECRHGTDA